MMHRNISLFSSTTKKTRGFTLVELIVVIAIIGILATIATVSYTKIMASGRDQQRVSDVTTIAEALENYYMKNGEYPGCPVINSSSDIQQALSPTVSTDVLTAPGATSQGTSLACGTSLTSTMGDKYIFVGDGSSICTTGSNCRYWTIQYRKESDNTIASIQSRHQADTTTIAAPGASTPAMTYGGGVVSATPSSVSCSQGAAQYAIRSNLNNGTWSAYTSFGTKAPRTLTASQGDKTDFQVQTRCYVTSEYISSITTGPATTYLVPITAPSAPVASVNTSTPNAANWSWTTVACPGSLTPTFRFVWAKDDATGWRAWSGASTTTSQSEDTTNQGYNYQLKAQQRCNSTYVNGDWSSDSNTVAYLRSIDAPAAPSSFQQTTTSSSKSGYSQTTTNMSWTESTCGSGTVKRLNLAVAYAVSASVPPSSTAYSTGYASYTPIWTTPANTQTYWKAASPGSNLTTYYSGTSGVTASDLANPSGNFGLSGSNDNPAWVSWGVTSASPLTISSGDWSSSSQNTKFTFARVYARNACFNPTTQRFAVGSYAFSPVWTWSSY